MPSPILTMTPEQRREMLVKANAARAAKPRPILRSDFPSDDEAEWSDLAAAAGVKLPPYGVPITTAGIRRFLEKLSIPVAAYIEWDGGKTLADFGRRNPSWPMKALAGVILENRERMLRDAQ